MMVPRGIGTVSVLLGLPAGFGLLFKVCAYAECALQEVSSCRITVGGSVQEGAS